MHQPLPTPAPSQPLTPIVLVEGFLSSTSSLFWGDFEAHLNATRERKGFREKRRIIFSSVGPASSLHDRACELYYSLKGGTVDYGAAHAHQHNHGRYGRHHGVGQYPSWSKDHPLHFIGHSMGGPTITMMITLLRRGFFPSGHPDMVLSLTAVSAPFRGTPLVYDLGESTTSAPAVRQLSIGSAITKIVHLATYISPLLPSFLLPDFHADARALSFREQSLLSLIRQLVHSDWAESVDATPFDVTFQGAEERGNEFWSSQSEAEHVNGEAETNADPAQTRTWYRSYCVTMTRRVDSSLPYHAPPPLSSRLGLTTFTTSGPLYVTSSRIGSFDISSIRPIPSFLHTSSAPSESFVSSTSTLTPTPSASYDSLKTLLEPESAFSSSSKEQPLEEHIDTSFNMKPITEIGEEYFANDGVVPLFSQSHPGACSSERCVHLPYSRAYNTFSGFGSKRAKPKPGVFYVFGGVREEGGEGGEEEELAHHLSILPFWVGSKRQKEFWQGLGAWLEDVEIAWEGMIQGR